MSETKIDPNEFASMSIAQYRKILTKDLARISKKTGYKNYVYLYNYKMGSKKTDILLFVDPEDEDWSAVMDEAMKSAKKAATGDCRVVELPDQDGDGEEDITIAIKTAEGGMNKDKVIEYLNNRFYEDNPSVEAVKLKDLEEDGVDQGSKSDEEIMKMRKSKKSKSGQAEVMDKENFLKTTKIKERTGKDAKKHPTMKKYLETLDKVFKNKKANDILNELKKEWSNVRKLGLVANPAEDYYKTTILPATKEFNTKSDAFISGLNEVIATGKVWLEGPGKRTPLTGRAEHKRKSENLKSQTALCNKLMTLVSKLDAANEQFQLEHAAKSALRPILNEYNKYDIEHDPYGEGQKHYSKIKSGAKMLVVLNQDRKALLDIYKKVSSWKKKFPDMDSVGQKDSFIEANRVLRQIDVKLKVLDENIKVHKEIGNFQVANPTQRKEMLKNEKFMNLINQYLPLDEYITKFYDKGKQELGLTFANFLKMVPPASAVDPKLDMDKTMEVYYFPKDTSLKIETLNPDNSVKSSETTTLSDAWTIAINDAVKVGSDYKICEDANDDGTKTVYWATSGPTDVPYVSAKGKSLFGASGRPEMKDIQQSDVANCYLLAALGSLVKNDPAAIEKMLHDDDANEIVYVRLFKVTRTSKTIKKSFQKKKGKAKVKDVHHRSGKGTGPYPDEDVETYDVSFKPIIIKVKKSIPSQGFNEANGVWVKMIEKAFAAGGFAGSYGTANPEKRASKTAWGFSEYALEVLTGKQSESHNSADVLVTSEHYVKKGYDIGGSAVWEILPWGEEELRSYQQLRAKKQAYDQLTAYKILKKNADVDTWFAYVRKGEISKLFNREYTADYSGEVTIDDLNNLFKGKIQTADGGWKSDLTKLNTGIAGKMIKWIKSERLFPGKLGTGQYSKLQESTYELIRKALKDDNKVVALGTHKNIARDSTGSGSSGGEAQAFGLAGSHAYTAIDCKLGDDGLLYVLVRNPWGSFARKYMKAGEALKEVNKKLKDRMNQKIVASKVTDTSIKNFTKQELIDKLKSVKLGKEMEKQVTEREVFMKHKSTDTVPVEDTVDADKGQSWIEISDLTTRFGSIDIN